MTKTRTQLGEFLRSRRERLRPEQVGLPDTPRRRTPGLRRQEVANLAGISAEWYVKLEQGRAVAPSPATLDALAQALCLTDAQHKHLRTLSRSDSDETWVREEVPHTLRRFVESLDGPAYVTGLRWDMLAWNVATAALFDDFVRLPVEDRNILLYMLTDPKSRALFGDQWADEARRMVALFRATHDRMLDNPDFVDLVARIRQGCPDFDAWWDQHDVAAAVSGTKYLLHPTLGRVGYGYATLQSNDDPRLKLVTYMPLQETGVIA